MKAEEFLKQYQSPIEGDFLKKHEFTIAKLLELYAEQKAVEFSEWLEKTHYWKSTDTRYPKTLGLWTTKINGDFDVSEGKTTEELYKEFNK